MIKINLLKAPEAPMAESPAGGVALTPVQQAQAFAGSLVVCLAIAGALYWYWNGQITKLTNDLANAKREAGRLAAIQAENQRYLVQLTEINRRLQTIQALEDKRVGPAALLSALGETVNQTRGLYLLTVSAETSRLNIQGQSDSVESIASFVAALKRAGSFDDVQLRQFFQDDQDNRVSFKFNLDCALPSPVIAAPGAASAPASAAKPGTATAKPAAL